MPDGKPQSRSRIICVHGVRIGQILVFGSSDVGWDVLDVPGRLLVTGGEWVGVGMHV
jgi:hypothetical protein